MGPALALSCSGGATRRRVGHVLRSCRSCLRMGGIGEAIAESRGGVAGNVRHIVASRQTPPNHRPTTGGVAKNVQMQDVCRQTPPRDRPTGALKPRPTPHPSFIAVSDAATADHRQAPADRVTASRRRRPAPSYFALDNARAARGPTPATATAAGRCIDAQPGRASRDAQTRAVRARSPGPRGRRWGAATPTSPSPLRAAPRA
jgi:hypothetical protein